MYTLYIRNYYSFLFMTFLAFIWTLPASMFNPFHASAIRAELLIPFAGPANITLIKYGVAAVYIGRRRLWAWSQKYVFSPPPHSLQIWGSLHIEDLIKTTRRWTNTSAADRNLYTWRTVWFVAGRRRRFAAVKSFRRSQRNLEILFGLGAVIAGSFFFFPFYLSFILGMLRGRGGIGDINSDGVYGGNIPENYIHSKILFMMSGRGANRRSDLRFL